MKALSLMLARHAGQFTKLFAKLVPQGHVYAFEPAIYTRNILEKVVKAHNLDNVSIETNWTWQ